MHIVNTNSQKTVKQKQTFR